MRSETVKHIVKYYGGIPEAIKLLKRERDALEDEYNGLGGLAMDGMPHSSAPGNPTEALAVRVIENGVKNRLQEIGVQVAVLEGDAANIRGALDAVNGKYKSVIIMRLIRGYSWTKISGKLGVPDSTARNWHGRPWNGWARCWKKCRWWTNWPSGPRARVHNMRREKSRKKRPCPGGIFCV